MRFKFFFFWILSFECRISLIFFFFRMFACSDLAQSQIFNSTDMISTYLKMEKFKEKKSQLINLAKCVYYKINKFKEIYFQSFILHSFRHSTAFIYSECIHTSVWIYFCFFSCLSSFEWAQLAMYACHFPSPCAN